MGASGKWIKSLVGLKAAEKAGKGRKWSRLWRSSSSSASRDGTGAGAGCTSPPCETSSSSSSAGGASSSVVAAVVRAPPRDFRVIRQEWAAVRVQTAFRAFLARRALKALRGIVRLQALVRGRLVRRQLAVTLDRMQALLRVQERAMERRARCSADGGDSQQDALSDRNGRADYVNEAEEQWCDSHGSISEVRSKLHMKHEGSVKRERAIAYALSHQPRSLKYSRRPNSPASSLRNHESYIEGWMATKPWESRYMDPNRSESHSLKNCEELNIADSKLDAGSVKIRRNNVTTRVEAKPPSVLSTSSSDFLCNESCPSTSSVTPGSATNTLASGTRSDCGHGGGPSYMSLTKSAKARLNSSNSRGGQFQMQRQGCGGLNSMSLKGQSMTRSLDTENSN